MSKQDYLTRYLAIIRKLKKSGGATFADICSYLERESELHDRPLVVSLRTFQRDVAEIRELFGIEIRYDFSTRLYNISEEREGGMNDRILESADTLNMLRMTGDLARYMHFEKRVAAGTHHFNGLLHAIRHRIVIRLIHQKFEDEEAKERLTEPLALKESRGRWYLLARDQGDKRLKTFGLDRMEGFEYTPGRFDYPASLDVETLFRHSFGVINPTGETPSEVILHFKPEQGKYIKTYPLHPSQQILSDSPTGLRISLIVWETRDLLMEILSYGENVIVISPQSLREAVRSSAMLMANQYNPT
jgi:predicted DNA-binding transcriptional regulator YafY